MYYDILDEKRKKILPKFERLKDRFYLAGGTALALQLGHRDSVDFNFFTSKDFDTEELFKELEQIFENHKILKTQEETGTLSVVIDDEINLSFFHYTYPLLFPLLEEPFLTLASLEDIACMKLSAIVGRSTNKDYIDLYFILKKIDLDKLLDLCKKKFKELDLNLVLKSLVYFDDIEEEPIMFKNGKRIDFEEVKKVLKEEVEKLEKAKIKGEYES